MARTVQDYRINTRSARLKLAIRPEPYFISLTRGCFIGYRKGAKGGNWIARWRDPDKKQHYNAIGPADDVTDDGLTAIDYATAQELARAWFTDMETGGDVRPTDFTVTNAMEEYLAWLAMERAESTVYDTTIRINKYIKPRLGRRKVATLSAKQIQDWRGEVVLELQGDKTGDDATRRSKDTTNRILTILKAGLNHAWKHDRIANNAAWQKVKPFKDVGESRKVFLSEAQCKRLTNACQGGFRHLVTGALVTGARYGELVRVRVQDFDGISGVVAVSGKTGSRDIFLDDAGVDFFEGLTTGKAPDELVFTRDDGKPWGKSHQHRPMQDAIKIAKVPADTNFYALRHTYASQRLVKGINHQILAENMGTSIRMLEKHYGKFMKQDRRNLMNLTAIDLDIPDSNVRSIKRG